MLGNAIKSDLEIQGNFGVIKSVEEEMSRGLQAASLKPAHPFDVQNFLVLHSPRVHGSAELLLQYESACRQQWHYLYQSKNTWDSFWSKSASPKTDISPCETRRINKGYYWRPPQSLKPVNYNTSPHRVCILHPRHTRHTSDSSSEDDSVKTRPLKSEILSLKPSTIGHTQATGKPPIRLPPIEELDRYETDYEPIEYIAKRNKLNINNYLVESTD
uniref:Uncharacterized protein n=1 Tax=Biomphalaria glabrata TaxID=6526 RepID=A0A2C9JHD3_BIOGL